MLLRHTTDKVAERKALTVNPAKTCQPIGAMYAALGVHGCLPHSHGSQGCCSYHRSALTRHYKEPVMASTSSFTEGTSVFGGQANLLTGLNNIFSLYNPDVVAVHSTCLSETIGDDLGQIAKKAIDDGKVPEGKHIVYAATPSYVGSHITGFANMVQGILRGFAEHTGEAKDQINIIPGWMEPNDYKAIKDICDAMGIKAVVCPDTDGVMNAPATGEHVMFPKGGTKAEDIKSMGDSIITLALGEWASELGAKYLDTTCKVPFQTLDLPIGLGATDRFVQALSQATGKAVPASITDERGRLVDLITDMSQYLFGKRVAIWGDPDQLLAMTEFLLDLDMEPVYVVTGSTPARKFEETVKKLVGDKFEVKVKAGSCADMFLMHQWIKEQGVDLLIGNTYGKYIARDEDLPFVRFGFPIFDRVGHQLFPTAGYTGAMRLVEQMLNAFMDKQDRECSEETFELVM
jgi:nitrogenase molybdenum-iron protein beta chain